MSDTWVLKFQQNENPQQPILIHVTRNDHENVLNLNLLATDGDEAYKSKVRDRNLNKHKASTYEGSDEEWSSILRYCLVSKFDSGISHQLQKTLDVDVVANGKGHKTTFSIVFRSRIEDITHKLGSIELIRTEDTDAVDLFGWACQAIDQRDSFERQLIEEKHNAKEAHSSIEKLTLQLEELLGAKEEHESQLFSKFVLLLNEKKLQIRNQQRIIAISNADSKKLRMLGFDDSGKSMASSTMKNKKKRQAKEDDDDDEDAFQTMEIDDQQGKDDASDETLSRQTTPSRSEATESEDEDENDALGQAKDRIDAKAAEIREPSPPPPPRSLPFQKKGEKSGVSGEPVAPAVQEHEESGDETASEDDEL